MDVLWDAVTGASRRLARSPGFTTAAVVIAAIGIATNVTVFTAVNAFLLKPRPWDGPERVVRIYQDSDDGNPSSTAFPAYRDMVGTGSVFEAVAAVSEAVLGWETDEGTRALAAEFTTASLLDVLGLEPALGRWFEPGHDHVGAGLWAVVGYRAWQAKMGGDPRVVGRTLRLNGQPVTVLGVGPQELTGSFDPLVTDIYLSISSVAVGGDYRVANLDRREDHWYDVRARLREGVTVDQAQAAMDALAMRQGEAFPNIDRGRGITVFPDDAIRLHPDVDGELMPAAALLMMLVGLVLLLACTNLATLLLVRGMAREEEVGIRRALGASRARVMGLLLSEAMLLAGVGGLIGVVLARQALVIVPSLPLPVPHTGELSLQMDTRVWLFALALVLATGVLFGLAPALRVTRHDVVDSLRGGGRSASPERGGRLFRNALIAVQVAASMVLLTATGLLVRSFLNQSGADPGVTVDGVAWLRTDMSEVGTSPAERLTTLADLEERMAALPGVLAVGATTRLPVENRGGTTTTLVDGYSPPSGTGALELLFAVADPQYFEVMEIPLVVGRLFDASDDAASARVALVSRAAAELFWPGQDPLGRLLRPQSAPDRPIEVVGVVEDVKVRTLDEGAVPLMYRPLAQAGVGPIVLVARGRGDGATLAQQMRRVLRERAPTLAVDDLGMMAGQLGEALATPRTAALLLAGLALTALLLASLGIYAVVSFAVRRRTSELGIRKALGASGASLLGLAVGEVTGAVALGLALGVALAAPLGKFLEDGLYGVGGFDPASYVGGAVILLLVAAGASYVPARRAVASDPTQALQAER